MPAFIKTDTHVTIVFDNGKNGTMFSSNPSFQGLCNSLKQSNWDEVYDFIFPIEQMRRVISDLPNNRVVIEHGIVMLDGNPIHSTLTNRIIEMNADGFDVTPMTRFLENLMDNPSFRAVTELYDFLESSRLPITEDGHFLAYKRVNSDLKDIYSGTMDNSIGQVVSMPRNKVNEDKHQTCSTGLHFCAREYLSSYGTGSNSKVVMVKINPRDVVSIPTDYNNAKGRCCEYEVIRELDIDKDDDYRLPSEKIECNFVEASDFTKTGSDVHMTLDKAREVNEMFDDITIHSSFNELLEHVTSKLDDETSKIVNDNANRLIGKNTLLDDNHTHDSASEIPTKTASMSKSVQKLSPVMGNGARVILAVYDSASAAMKDTGINSSSITKVCKGERQSAGGYKWDWLPETPTMTGLNSLRNYYNGLDIDDASREEEEED